MSSQALGAPPASAAGSGRRRSRSKSKSRSREPGSAGEGLLRLLAALVAVCCLTGALLLAWRHPLAPWALIAALPLLLLLGRYFWMMLPGWSLGLLPWLGMAPATGWLLVEELDIALLALAAAGYLAISGPHLRPPPPVLPRPFRQLRWRKGVLLLLGLAVLSCTVSVLRGLTAWGSAPGWFNGYHEAGASLRVLKPVLALLLFLPLWWRVSLRRPDQITPSLLGGASLALLGCSLPALAERWSFTGLVNFSSDYRVTGPFWEMHVGGAALDGALALLMPLALLQVLRARALPAFGLGAAVLTLGAYICLVTFSRGLYLALALSLPLMLACLWAQRRRQQQLALAAPAASPTPGLLRALLPPLLLAVVAASLMFGGSGYRGVAALFLLFAALLFQPAPAAPQRWLAATLLGLLLALPVLGTLTLATALVPKLPYVAVALLSGVSLLLGEGIRRGRLRFDGFAADALRAACWYALLGGVALVAGYWGGSGALTQAALPLLLLTLAWPWCQAPLTALALHRLPQRQRSGALALLLVALGVIAALGGGAYVGGRVATTATDLDGRNLHWRQVLATLEVSKNWALGVGAGRFVPLFAAHAQEAEQTGDYRLREGPPPALWMRAGMHTLGHGEYLRLSQQIDAAPAGLELRVAARNDAPQQLYVEVCAKHLIYTGGCRSAEKQLPASPNAWTEHRLRLSEGALPEGWLVFSMAAATRGGEMELTRLSLRGADGRELLRNGDFKADLAHWFPSSDRHHLPWHAKSLPLHLLFEQGLIGLSLAGLLFIGALARLGLGEARDHPLAPALLAGLLGFAIVGLFDSLVDAPRIALLVLMLLLIALGLRAPPPEPHA